MPTHVDLRKLAEITAPERAFLSVYLAGPHSMAELKNRFQQVRRVLKGGVAEDDEREQFEENVKAVEEYLERNPLKSGSLCIFSSWILNFFQAVPLSAPVKDVVRIDSSPYIRPLAEFEEEYENAAVVVADNRKARIFLVSMAVAGSEDVVKGNVKNHVKKGGWSQQRYERRRDKQLQLYARDIADALVKLEEEEDFRHIVLVGSKEILHIVHQNLPQALQNKVAEKALDLGRGEGAVNEDIMDLLLEEERLSERDLWERIRAEYLQHGLAVIGLHDVLSAAKEGRIEKMIVNRTFKPEGRRCRDCEHLDIGAVETCSACGSKSLFEVDVVNEIVEMLERSSAEADFTDPIQTLVDAGEIAALLRYRV
jgi:peptide chain release factor subunit 1